MKPIVISIFTILFSLGQQISLAQSKWNAQLEDKIKNAVQATYGIEQFELIPMSHSAISSSSQMDQLQNFRQIQVENSTLGLIYVDQAPSMKNVFDYLVMFEKDLTIKKAKVLIYREQHGRQIGTMRWLSQFVGLSPKDRPSLGEEVDGISGATISCTNMTLAIKNLLILIDENYQFFQI